MSEKAANPSSARILAVANQKGGVGKTTTAINLAASLAAAEHRTLLVDMDPQGNAGSGLGISSQNVPATIYEVLVGTRSIADVRRSTELRFLDLAPANSDLTGAELELVQAERREFRLRDALEVARGDYEYIIVDSPPSLGLLTLNALAAADAVIVPLQCEYYALEGLSHLLQTIELVKSGVNPKLQIEGVLLTLFDSRVSISHQVAQEVKSNFSGRVFDTVIPRNVRLSECPSFGKPILLYDIHSKGCESYLALAKEILSPREGAVSAAV